MGRRGKDRVSKEKSNSDGKYVDKEAVPKEGTKLTPERIAKHYRSLNREKKDQAGA